MLSGQLCVALRRKHERGFGCSTRSTIRKDDACWQPGDVVFLSDCVTPESSDLSPLLYLHSWTIKSGAQSSQSTLPCETNKLLLKWLTISWQSCSRSAPVYRSAIQIIIYGWCFSRTLIADSAQFPFFPPHQLSHAVSAFVYSSSSSFLLFSAHLFFHIISRYFSHVSRLISFSFQPSTPV